MIITALETILIDAFPNLCYLRLHTDVGLIGLGETFFGPEAVAAYRAYLTGAYREIVTTLPRIEGGHAYPPEGSGLGTALRPDFIARSDASIRRTER